MNCYYFDEKAGLVIQNCFNICKLISYKIHYDLKQWLHFVIFSFESSKYMWMCIILWAFNKMRCFLIGKFLPLQTDRTEIVLEFICETFKL